MPAAARATKISTRTARNQNQHKVNTRDSNRDKVISGKGGYRDPCYRDPYKLAVLPHWLYDNTGFLAHLVKAREVNGKRLGVIAKPVARAKTKRQ